MTSEYEEIVDLAISEILDEVKAEYQNPEDTKWTEAFDFSEPVPVMMAITSTGKLSFYIDRTVESCDDEEFAKRAIYQSIGTGVQVVGHFRATITLGEFYTYTMAQHHEAIGVFADDRRAEYLAIYDSLLEDDDE